jgi:hypothetical protein
MIVNPVIRLVISLLTNTHIRTQTAHGLSTESIKLEKGVPQGDPMAPIFFDIVIDALHDLLTAMTDGFNVRTTDDNGEPQNEALHSLAFADDISTYSEKIDDLQQKHDIVELFADILDVSINMQKTVLIASEGEGRAQPPAHLNPDQLFARNKDNSLNKLTVAGKWSNTAAAEPSRRRTPDDAVIMAKDGSKTIAINATEQFDDSAARKSTSTQREVDRQRACGDPGKTAGIF